MIYIVVQHTRHEGMEIVGAFMDQEKASDLMEGFLMANADEAVSFQIECWEGGQKLW